MYAVSQQAVSESLTVGRIVSHWTRYAVKMQSGCTALHYAAYTGCTTVVATLMQNRADPAVVNADGQRPLDLTGKSKLAPRGMTEISLLLQGKDALPDKGGCVVS
ncbi:hypothetical protein T484DRAFT_1814067 [Baffinella frigidus]|nr:hypothetical protein T484DRAFT_1814067 [Cryptophyta sp. CCMP2293]